MEVADRIVVMNQGRIEQMGAPDEVYDHPATPFVLKFLGDVNVFPGSEPTRSKDGHAAGQQASQAQSVSYVRPHDIQVLTQPVPGSVSATLMDVLTVGPNTRLAFERSEGEGDIEVELTREAFAALRDAGVLAVGQVAHLQARQVRQFNA